MQRHAQLDFVAVWHDEDMIELRVVAANDSFRGVTEAYFSPAELLRLADFIEVFPQSYADKFEFCSASDPPAVRLRFYCIDGARHGAVRAALRRNLASNSRAEEEDYVELEILLGMASVGAFSRQLRSIANENAGTATLFPREDG